MAAKELHVGDIGTILEAILVDGETPVPIQGAATREIILKPPKAAKKVKAAAFTTDGSDGKIRYVTATGDLDEAGTWRMQAHIAGTGFDQKSQVIEFEVAYNL